MIAAALGALELVPRWALLAWAVAASIAAGGALVGRSTARSAYAQEKAAAAVFRADAASAALSASEKYRATEARWAVDREVSRALAKDQLETLATADRRGAGGPAGLRDEAARLLAGCRPASGAPPALGGGAPAADPGMVLAELLERMGSAGRDVARLADLRGIALAACLREARPGLAPEVKLAP